MYQKELSFKKENNWKRTHFCTIDGMIIPYWMCDVNDDNLHNEPKFSHLKLEYLGQGRVYSIDGVIQNDNRLMHFYSLEN